MKKYLKVYLALLRINLISLVVYRMNFVNSIISSLMWGVFSVSVILIITSRADVLFGWKRNEIILLAAVYSLIVATFHIFFARSFERLTRIIYFGTFDFELVKPLDSQFSISFWHVNYAAISRIIMGLGLIFYFVWVLGYSITIYNVSLFIFLIFFGVLTLYCIWFTVSTLLIKFPEISNVLELLYSMNGITRFPPEMFKTISPFIFLILLPFMFVAASPFKVLVGKADLSDTVILVSICVVMLIASRIFWKRTLRSYTSASN